VGVLFIKPHTFSKSVPSLLRLAEFLVNHYTYFQAVDPTFTSTSERVNTIKELLLFDHVHMMITTIVLLVLMEVVFDDLCERVYFVDGGKDLFILFHVPSQL